MSDRSKDFSDSGLSERKSLDRFYQDVGATTDIKKIVALEGFLQDYGDKIHISDYGTFGKTPQSDNSYLKSLEDIYNLYISIDCAECRGNFVEAKAEDFK